LKKKSLQLVNILLLVAIAGFLSACDQISLDFLELKKNKKGTPVARVHDSYLYEDDLKLIVNSNMSAEDSIMQVNNYINNWVKKELLLTKADINLADKKNKFEYLVNKYREDLYINSYKEAVIQQYLNTKINPSDIDIYYEENRNNFKLNEELLMLRFINIRKDLDKEKKEHLLIEQLLKSSKQEDKDQLSERVLSFENYHLNDSVWIKYSDLINKIPFFKEVDKKSLMRNRSFIKKEDSLSHYLVYVKKALERNQVTPKKYITPTIEQMILHQRKLKLLNNMEEEIYKDANRNNQIEIYSNESQ